jgi:hypothetical protein
MHGGGGASMSAGERFAREQQERRLRWAREREEKRKQYITGMPGYVEEAEPEAMESPSRRKVRAGNEKMVEAPEGLGMDDLKPTTRARGNVSLDASLDGDGPLKRSAAVVATPEEDFDAGHVSSGVAAGGAPPRLSRAASIHMHERISQRVQEVQDEIEELEQEVEALRASRASRRMSTASVGGGLKRRSTAGAPGKRASTAGAPGKRASTAGESSKRISQYDTRQIGPTDMKIGAPTNFRKTAGVQLSSGGGFELASGDPRFLPKDMRRKLGLLDISEPENDKKAAGVKLGPDGKFQVGGELTEEMRQALEEIESKKRGR